MNKDTDTGGLHVAISSSGRSVPIQNALGRTGRDRDFLHVAEGARALCGTRDRLKWDAARRCLVSAKPVAGEAPFASYVSNVIQCRFPARQFLPSWNVKVAAGSGFRIYLRAFDKDGESSPWFFMGEGGAWRKQADEVTSDETWGEVRIDYLNLNRAAHGFQYKVDFIAPWDGASAESAELHRFFMHYSGIAQRNTRPLRTAELETVRLGIPYRSQLDVDSEELRHVICCPTCVAMVLESRGIDRATMDICNATYDERHDIYGIWPRASQAAFENGVKSWVQRFRHMAGVRACLQGGQPIIASIRVSEGELRGARYPSSKGHLIVIKGIAENGKIVCNDPYSAGPSGDEIEYELEDIEKVWLDCGGVAVMVEKAV